MQKPQTHQQQSSNHIDGPGHAGTPESSEKQRPIDGGPSTPGPQSSMGYLPAASTRVPSGPECRAGQRPAAPASGLAAQLGPCCNQVWPSQRTSKHTLEMPSRQLPPLFADVGSGIWTILELGLARKVPSKVVS